MGLTPGAQGGWWADTDWGCKLQGARGRGGEGARLEANECENANEYEYENARGGSMGTLTLTLKPAPPRAQV